MKTIKIYENQWETIQPMINNKTKGEAKTSQDKQWKAIRIIEKQTTKRKPMITIEKQRE